MPISEESRKKQIAYNDQYIKTVLDRIVIKPRKTSNYPARIQSAVDAGNAASRQAYIIEAIEQRLEKDGF